MKEDGSDRLVISGLLSDMLVDVAEICKRKKYWEALEIMETTYQTHSQILVEKSKLEIAKNLLDILNNSIIALKTGLPLRQIEQLRADS